MHLFTLNVLTWSYYVLSLAKRQISWSVYFLFFFPGLPRHSVQGFQGQHTRKAAMDIRTLRPQRRRAYHQERNARRSHIHLRNGRKVHRAPGWGELSQGTRGKAVSCEFNILLIGWTKEPWNNKPQASDATKGKSAVVFLVFRKHKLFGKFYRS